MSEEFLLESHYIVKALEGIEFPITKDKLVEDFGDKEIKIDYDKYIKLKEKVNLIEIEKFNSAAEFYSALYSI